MGREDMQVDEKVADANPTPITPSQQSHSISSITHDISCSSTVLHSASAAQPQVHPLTLPLCIDFNGTENGSLSTINVTIGR